MDWKNLPSYSRVWIYQADRILNDSEVDFIKKESQKFVSEWASHGTPLEAAIEVFHHLFVVVFVNEQQAMASGCSIDKSVGLIRFFEKQLKVDFMNRMIGVHKAESGIELFKLNELSDKIAANKMSLSSTVFNNLVATKKEFEENWLVKIENSWHKQFV